MADTYATTASHSSIYQNTNPYGLRVTTAIGTLADCPGIEFIGGAFVDGEMAVEAGFLSRKADSVFTTRPPLNDHVADELARPMDKEIVLKNVAPVYCNLAGRHYAPLEIEHSVDWGASGFRNDRDWERIKELVCELPGTEWHDRMYIVHESLDVDPEPPPARRARRQ